MKKKTISDEAMTLALRACEISRVLDERMCNYSAEVDRRLAKLERLPLKKEPVWHKWMRRRFGGWCFISREHTYEIINLWGDKEYTEAKGNFEPGGLIPLPEGCTLSKISFM